MADITSEPVAGFISESVADLPRNQQRSTTNRSGSTRPPPKGPGCRCVGPARL